MKFIDDFVNYARDFTGCPTPFLRWSALLCLSTIAGRKHRLLRGNWDVVPNLWVLLLGSSSSYKSTGLAIARKLLREASPDLLMGQEYSHEKLLEDLSTNSHRLFTYDEAESFFMMLNQKYNAPMKSALMSLWRDDFYERSTKGGGQITIRNAYLCWGGASTPVQLARQMEGKDSDLLSGMLPRFMIVPFFGDEKSIIDPPPHDSKKRDALVAQLRSFAVCGERQYSYTPEALALKEEWFNRFQSRLSGVDNRMAPFFRKMRDEHYHKIAILSAFARQDTNITVDDLAEVTNFLSPIETALPDVLEQLCSDQWARDSDRIKQVLKKAGVTSRTALADKVRIRGMHLDKHLSHLKSDQLIEVGNDNNRANRPTQVIKWLG
jgi:hypothetical protein